MTKCNKCNIELNTIDDICPLCKSEIKNKGESIYPVIKNNLTNKLLMKKISYYIIRKTKNGGFYYGIQR